MKKTLFAAAVLSAALMMSSLAGPIGVIATASYNDTVQDTPTPAPETSVPETPVEAAPAPQTNVVDVDWGTVEEKISAEVEAIAAGDTAEQNVDVLAGTKYTVSEAAISNLSGADCVLALQTGKGLAFSISGEDVKEGAEFSMDMSFDAVIPASVIESTVENAVAFREFSMADKDNFGFKVDVHINVGAENAGKTATLYSYDEETEKMTRHGSFKVTEEGQTMFAIWKGDTYVVIVK